MALDSMERSADSGWGYFEGYGNEATAVATFDLSSYSTANTGFGAPYLELTAMQGKVDGFTTKTNWLENIKIEVEWNGELKQTITKNINNNNFDHAHNGTFSPKLSTFDVSAQFGQINYCTVRLYGQHGGLGSTISAGITFTAKLRWTGCCYVRVYKDNNFNNLIWQALSRDGATVSLPTITTQFNDKPGYEVLAYRKRGGYQLSTYPFDVTWTDLPGLGDIDLDLYPLWGKVYRVGLYEYDGTQSFLSSSYDVNYQDNGSSAGGDYVDSNPKTFYFPASNPSQYIYYPSNSYIPKTNTSPALYFIGWQYSTSNVSYNGTDQGQQPNSVITLDTNTSHNGGIQTVTEDGTTKSFHLIKYYGIWNPRWEVIYKDGNTVLLNTSYTNYSDYTINSNSNFNNNQGIESLHPEKQFLGWKEASENQIRQGGYTFSNPGRALTLSAQWQDKYKVTFYNGSTKLYESDYILKNGSYTIPADTTIRNGGIQILDDTKQFLGWSTSSTATSADYTSGSVIQTVTGNITLYAVWIPRYTITYKNNNTILTTSNYLNKNAIYTVIDLSENQEFITVINNNPSQQFIGWSETENSASPSYNTGSQITIINNIILYPVWRNRDSLQFNENINNIATINVLHYTALNNGIYYFDDGVDQSFTITLNTTTSDLAKEYYIYNVTTNPTYNFITNGTMSNDYRTWTSGSTPRLAGTNNTVITVNINYYKNLRLDCYIFQTRKNLTRNVDNNFDSIFDLQVISNRTDLLYGSADNNDPGGTDTTPRIYTTNNEYSYKQITVYINPTDSLQISSSCTNNNFYITSGSVPIQEDNINGSDENSLNPSARSASEVYTRSELQLNTGNLIHINDQNCSSGTAVFTARGNTYDMGDANNHRKYKIFFDYDAFNCQLILTDMNRPTVLSNTISNNTYIRTVTENSSQYIQDFKIFNDITTLPYFYYYRDDGASNKYAISNIEINSQTIDFKKEYLINGVINDYFNLLTNSNGSVSTSNIQKHNYYLNNFLGYKINFIQSMISSFRSDPYTINVTWASNDYKCFIIAKIVEKNDAPEESVNTTLVNDIINFQGTGWNSYVDENVSNSTSNQDRNRKIYIKEINLNTTQGINATLSDIASQGYLFKDIKKYSYNGNYNSTLTDPPITITREALETGTTMPTSLYMTRTSSNNSNDILSLNNTSATAGMVDYYFITYEEGLPIYYPGTDSTIKRAIQLYWETNKAIGLYYGNIKLL